MLYALDDQEVAELKGLELVPRFHGARMLLVVFRTDADVVRTVLPRQLQPCEDPLGVAFVADYASTNFGLSYREAGLSLRCRLGRESGLYHLCMPVDDDVAMVGGRESFGFPKKMAESISLHEGQGALRGTVVRRGVELMHIEAKTTGPASDDDVRTVFDEHDGQPCSRSFLFKFFPAPGGKSLDYLPRIVRQQTAVAPLKVQQVDAELTLRAALGQNEGEIVLAPDINTARSLLDGLKTQTAELAAGRQQIALLAAKVASSAATASASKARSTTRWNFW